MNNKKTLTKLICTNLAIVILLCFCSSLFCGCGRNNEPNVTFVPSVNTVEEFVDVNLLGTEVNVTLFGKKITAVYNKTVHYVFGDITERRYKIIGIEKDGVVEQKYYGSVNYIGLNDEGEIISYSEENIMYTGLECKYDIHGENVIKYGYSFGMTKDELRLHMETLLGDITDWSLYNEFDVEFHYASVRAITNGWPSDSRSATLHWIQKSGELQNRITVKDFSCTIEFALLENEGEEDECRVFYENAFIKSIETKEPFGEVTDLSPYLKKYSGKVVDEALNTRFSTAIENGYKREYELNGAVVSVYDGKICYMVPIKWSKKYDFGTQSFSVYAIFPLE